MVEDCELLRSVRSPSGESWSALLNIDQEHPFFFDHPVDHVPGMVLMSSLIALAERAGVECEKNKNDELVGRVVELNFLRICELDEPSHAHASMVDKNGFHWNVEVTQKNRKTCAGSIRLAPLRGLPTSSSKNQKSVTARPASGTLTHRRRPENIVVSGLERTDHRLMVSYLGTPQSRRRSRCVRSTHAIEELFEAARQFATLMCHSVGGVDINTRLLLNSVFVTVSRPLPRHAPITLLSAGPEIRQRRMTNMFDIDSGGRTVGSAKITSSILRMVNR